MIINVASFGGRTHLLDTARELEKQGHTVRFYSYVPTKRAVKFGLKKECNYSIFWFAFPYLIWMKLFGFGGWATFIYHRLCDLFIAYYMKPCDVFIGQSPMHYYSIKYAKKKWNAITILERGTSHILEYINNLSTIPNFKRPKSISIKYDLKGYKVADYISVGAEHVKESFMKHGFPENKIFVNNYGFNNTQFKSTTYSGPYDIIMVGTWSYRKGCDLLIEACRQKHYKLLHVGPHTDLNIPPNSNITDIGTVDQRELLQYYQQARVFVLPSREEGLALVQMQAAACGLPIVCSTKSGGKDIKKYTQYPEHIIEMKELTVNELCNCIDKALQLALKQQGKREYLGEKIQEASFEGYGNRYNHFLQKIKNNPQ